MDTGVIIALILAVASVLSSIFFGYIPAKKNEEIKELNGKVKTLNDKVKTLLQDVDSLLKIETELIEEHKDAQTKSKQTIKIDIRGKVRNATNHPLSNYATPSAVTKELSRFQ